MREAIRKFARSAMFVLAMLTVAGCATSSPVPTFDLTAPSEFPLPRGRTHGQLLVPEPAALAILDTERIVVRPGGDQVAQLGDAQWVDRLPKLLQARIVQAFENTNRLRAVGRPGERIVPDYQLLVDVRRFNLAVDGAPRAEVELSAKLVADASGRAVASRIFRASVPAAASEGEAAVRAIDAAFNQVVTDLVVWAARRV